MRIRWKYEGWIAEHSAGSPPLQILCSSCGHCSANRWNVVLRKFVEINSETARRSLSPFLRGKRCNIDVQPPFWLAAISNKHGSLFLYYRQIMIGYLQEDFCASWIKYRDSRVGIYLLRSRDPTTIIQLPSQFSRRRRLSTPSELFFGDANNI